MCVIYANTLREGRRNYVIISTFPLSSSTLGGLCYFFAFFLSLFFKFLFALEHNLPVISLLMKSDRNPAKRAYAKKESRLWGHVDKKGSCR